VHKDKEGNVVGVFDRQANFKIFSDLINGLVEIHKNHIVHRDIKPENIFIDDSKKGQLPTAKIGDFGLARMLTVNDQEEEPTDKRYSNASTFGSSSKNLEFPELKLENKSSSMLSTFSTIAGT
jgi:serine/threonine protein kinase